MLVAQVALAAGPTFEFHHDAPMQHRNGESLREAYGYAYVATDMRGHGVIRVMFSNGSELDNARFNALLTFRDADGRMIRSESFSERISAAGADGAAEHRLSRLVNLNQFESLEIDFFLSDVPAGKTNERTDQFAARPVAGSLN